MSKHRQPWSSSGEAPSKEKNNPCLSLPCLRLLPAIMDERLLVWKKTSKKKIDTLQQKPCPTFFWRTVARNRPSSSGRRREARFWRVQLRALAPPSEGRLFLGAWHVFSWLMCYLRSLGTVFLCPQNHVPKALAALLGGVWLTKPHLGNPKWSKVTIHDGSPSCHCPSIFRGYKVSPKTHIIRAEKPVFFYALFNGLFDPHNSIMIGLLSSMVPPPVSFTT